MTSTTLAFTGAPVNQSLYLAVGDYIEVRTTGAHQLCRVLSNVSTNSSGAGSILIWPSLRKALAANSPLIVENTRGLFRLATNESAYTISPGPRHKMAFVAQEAIS